MIVTATEFKKNLGKYFDMLIDNDIWITKNGKTIAVVSYPESSAVDAISGVLKGKVPEDLDRHSLREERLNRYADDD